MSYPDCKSIEDLIFDRSFINYVLHKEPEPTAFWENWINQNPGKLKIFADAKSIVYAMQIKSSALADSEVDLEVKKVLAKLKDQPSSVNSKVDNFSDDDTRNIKVRRRYYVFASVASLLVILAAFYFFASPNDSHAAGQFFGLPGVINENNVVLQLNNSDTIRLEILPDQTKVYLAQNSSIRFEKGFPGKNRNVYLRGEAFFEVSRNVVKPFHIYSRRIVTKVLGTSFRVRAFESDERAIVTVKTGKVLVYKTDAFKQDQSKGTGLQGIVVTANQKASYSSEGSGFIKTLTKQPGVVATDVAIDFNFKGIAVSKIFKVLEDAYRIPFIYDDEVISSCTLSANLGDKSFFEKLDIICRATKSTYEIMDGTIIITSKGCTQLK